MILDGIRQPADLKNLDQKALDALADQLRQRILQVVSQTGGHLASNLGMVELTLALHRVFDSPRDQIVFDVGHQCYAHKILTGRNEHMDSLRQYQGLSGFPKRSESPHDIYETGHASTSISAALGLARARDLLKDDYHVIAVVGDGAMTGGLCYEALNDAGMDKTRLIIILNDNQMSIAPNVGGLSEYLTYMRTSKAWLDIKRNLATFFLKIPLVGKPLHHALQKIKDSVRNIFITDGFFDSLGWRYLGPVDGHQEQQLEKLLRRAKRLEGPVILHVVTRKGKGYEQAEKEPWSNHGVNPFYPENGQPRCNSQARIFGKVAGEMLVKMAAENERIVAISAAMVGSTGLGPFQIAYPHRLFDVGIAEAHAVTLAAGLARGGMRPVVALYDTFLQRAYDQVVVDICLQNLPVTFLIDRAAMGGADGPTHHGVFGTAFLRHIPHLQLLYPRSIEEMQQMLAHALSHPGPVFIRYPRTEEAGMDQWPYCNFIPGKWEQLVGGKDLALLTMGPMVTQGLEARKILKTQGIQASVFNASSQKPIDNSLVSKLSEKGIPYYVLEEQVLAGGLGSAVSEYCVQHSLTPPRHIFCLPDEFIPQGTHSQLLTHCGLDAASIAEELLRLHGVSS